MRLRRFLTDEHGSATVEFVLWVPWFALLLMLTVDVSMFYLSQTRMQNVSRDAARRLSIGLIEPANLATYVRGELTGDGYVVIDCSNVTDSCVRIERSASATLVFGAWLDSVIGSNFFVETRMPFEPRPV